ncbi:MAG: DUF454 domain-containing protein [Epulopiscium sp.]|nr:DUF454 domain-containing protein [Candidatus Epulonipiscium sp.]
MKSVIKKTVYIFLGFLFLITGVIGVIIPILPTTPFLLGASFFFVRGSKLINKWFLSTRLYKNNLKDFVESRAMASKTKVKILFFATILLLFAIYLLNNIHGRIVIICVMLYKYYYFIFCIKTIRQDNSWGKKRVRLR